MRPCSRAPKAPLVRPKSAKIDAAVTYLAGGPAAGIPVTVRHRIEPRTASFAGLSRLRLRRRSGEGGRADGLSADAFRSGMLDRGRGFAGRGESGRRRNAVATKNVHARRGGHRGAHDRQAAADRAAREPRGRDGIQRPERRAPRRVHACRSASGGLYVGIKTDGWAASKSGVNAQVLVLDTAGKPVADTRRLGRCLRAQVLLQPAPRAGRLLRLRLGDGDEEGGRRAAPAGPTRRGSLFCAVKPGAHGRARSCAQALDDAERAATATTSVWVAGDGEWWFEPASNDRMDLVPEKKRYEPGETARFQVRMPFRSATVLVTVEREGVLAHASCTARREIAGDRGARSSAATGRTSSCRRSRCAGASKGAGAEPPTALVDLGEARRTSWGCADASSSAAALRAQAVKVDAGCATCSRCARRRAT